MLLHINKSVTGVRPLGKWVEKKRVGARVPKRGSNTHGRMAGKKKGQGDDLRGRSPGGSLKVSPKQENPAKKIDPGGRGGEKKRKVSGDQPLGGEAVGVKKGAPKLQTARTSETDPPFHDGPGNPETKGWLQKKPGPSEKQKTTGLSGPPNRRRNGTASKVKGGQTLRKSRPWRGAKFGGRTTNKRGPRGREKESIPP